MEDQTPTYLSETDVIQLHDEIIRRMGGMSGVRDHGAVQSSVAQPRMQVFGQERFPGIYDKAAAYCFFLVKNHPFFDGNKRTGFLASLHFLLINGIVPLVEQDEMYETINGIARGTVDIGELAAILRKGGGRA